MKHKYLIMFSILVIGVWVLGKSLNYKNTSQQKEKQPTSQKANTISPTKIQVEKNKVALSNQDSNDTFNNCNRNSLNSNNFKSTKLYKQELLSFIKTLRVNDIPEPTINKILLAAGVSFTESKKALDSYSAINKTRDYEFVAKTNLLDYEVETNLKDFAKNKNYFSIAEVINNNNITNDYIIDGVTILSYLLIKNSNIQHFELQTILDTGLQVTFKDLINATRIGFNTDIIAILHNNYKQDINRTWSENYHLYSLTIKAAQVLNVEAYDYWSKNGIAPVTNENFYNSMDALPSPRSEIDIERATKIITHLFSVGVSPSSLSSLSKIERWLPPQLKVNYSDVLDINNIEKLTLEERNLVLQLENIIQRAESINKKSACGAITQVSSSQVKQTLPPPISNGLYIIPNSNDIPLSKNEQQIMVMFLEKNWNNIIKESQLSDDPSFGIDLLNIALLQAIKDNEHINVIRRLLNEGANIPHNIILILSLKNNVKLAKFLLPYGLNLHYTDKDGRNGITMTVINTLNKEMFDFLIDHGVNIDLKNELANPLDLILSKTSDNNIEYFFEKLIYERSAILPRHQTKLDLIHANNPELFRRLSSYLP